MKQTFRHVVGARTMSLASVTEKLMGLQYSSAFPRMLDAVSGGASFKTNVVLQCTVLAQRKEGNQFPASKEA